MSRTMRTISTFILLTVLASLLVSDAAADERVAAAVRAAREIAQQGPFLPKWKSLEQYEIPAWYRDAKFGIFIHWGVYCVPAYLSEWYPAHDVHRPGHLAWQRLQASSRDLRAAASSSATRTSSLS